MTPDLFVMSDVGLYRRRRLLIQAEPASDHSPLACPQPATCPQCREWVRWGRELSRVDNELMRRERAELKK